MPREPEKPTAFDAGDLNLLKSTLESYTSSIERALAYLDAKDEPALWVFKAPSLNTGLKTIRPFMDALEHSLQEAASGQPITAETRKTRQRKSQPDS